MTDKPFSWTGIALRIVLIAFLTGFTVVCFARFGGGEGTEDNPWIIATAEHLDNIRNYLGAEHSDKYYRQTADIDLGTAPYNIGQGWVPIGSSEESSFQGHYDGNGHIISNLTINRSQPFQALFGHVVDGTIIRLGLKDVDIYGMDAAGLVGIIRGKSLVQYCFVTGHVRGKGTFIGGLIGVVRHHNLPVKDCYSAADVTHLGNNSDARAAGLIGLSSSNLADRLLATGSLVTEYGRCRRMHPAVGSRTGMYVYWNVDIPAETRQRSPGINNGHTTNELLNRETFEGFDFDQVWAIDEGVSYPYLQWEGTQAQAHNLPNLLPPLKLTADGSKSVVTLTWKPPNPQMGTPDSYNIYRDNRKIAEVPMTELRFLDKDVIYWTSYSYVVKAVYEGQESIPSNIVNITPLRGLSPAVQKARERARHVALLTEGSGTQDDPYLISDAKQLDNIRNFLGYHYLQTADIDLNEAPWSEREGWQPIGNAADKFEGSFDGNGHVIRGLIIRRNENGQGLFGQAVKATFKNINLTEVDIKGRYKTGALLGKGTETVIKNCSASGKVSHYKTGSDYMGGLVGFLYGSIYDSRADVEVYSPQGIAAGGLLGTVGNFEMERCFAKGDVTARSQAGGLAGRTYNGIAKEIYAEGSVTGNDVIGGLFGFIHNTRCLDSYSTANVSGKNKVGGLIGTYSHRSTLRNSYAKGKVTGDTNAGGLIGYVDFTGGSLGLTMSSPYPQVYQPYNCYWDTDTTGQTESPGGNETLSRGYFLFRSTPETVEPHGGEPRTSRQMTYPHDDKTYQDWDFSAIWKLDTEKEKNNGYPYLRLVKREKNKIMTDFGTDTFRPESGRILPPKQLSLLQLFTLTDFKSLLANMAAGIIVSLIIYYLLFKIWFFAGVTLLIINLFLKLFFLVHPDPLIMHIYISIITLMVGLLICWLIYKQNLYKESQS